VLLTSTGLDLPDLDPLDAPDLLDSLDRPMRTTGPRPTILLMRFTS
jgi:hypothetical protein